MIKRERMSRIQKEREREKRKKRGRKRDDKPTLLGHFKVPLPVFQLCSTSHLLPVGLPF